MSVMPSLGSKSQPEPHSETLSEKEMKEKQWEGKEGHTNAIGGLKVQLQLLWNTLVAWCGVG